VQETPVVKKSIAPLKKFVIAKNKKSIVPNQNPPSTRNIVRLSARVTKEAGEK